MPAKRSLAELLSHFARRIDDRREQDGIRGYLKILKDITGTDILYVAKVVGRQANVVVGLNGEENFDEFVYDLKDTPCDIASAGQICSHSPDVQQRYPKDELLIEMNINGYIGLPLYDLSGSVHGIIVGLNHHKVEISKDDILLFRMVSQLIQVEFRNMIESSGELNAFDSVDVGNVQNLGRFFYSVLENLPGSISVITTENKFVYVNRPYADFHQLKPEDIIGKNIEDIFSPEMIKVSNRTNAEVINLKQTSNFSHKTPLENGDYVYSNVTKFPFINSDGEVFAVGMMSLDITESVKDRRNLREEKLKNIHSSKLATVGEMAAGMTHELGNPLTIIQGLAEKLSIVVKRDLDIEAIQQDISKIQRASDRMGKLISSLRVFSRDDSKSSFEVITLKEVVDVTLDLISHRFEKDGVKFEKSKVCEGCKINAQTVLISQVLVNLLINSLDAISDLQEKWIKLDVREEGENYHIRVIDSGSGIPENIVENIFNSFYTTKDIGKGTGLGLSLCQDIIQRHNGTLEYVLYKGNTSFLLKIPKA